MRTGAGVRAAVVAAVLAALAVPAGARADDRDRLVVVGARSAVVDFEVVDRAVQLDPRHVVVTGGRQYVALWISSLEQRRPSDAFGVLRAPLGRSTFGFPELRPGRYRARLMTDAPARVVLPLFSRNGRVLRATVPLRVAVRTGAAEVGPGLSHRALRLEDAVPAGTHALFARRVTGERAEQTHACVTAARSCRNLPVTPPLVPAPDSPVVLPSNGTAVVAGVTAPAAHVRDALLAVEGARTTGGVLQSFVLTFHDPPVPEDDDSR